MTRTVLFLAIAAAGSLAAQGASEEALAQRRFQSGRQFAQQANYGEALRDFEAVFSSYPSSSVADNALLEIGRYYLDLGSDPARALTAVELIINKYSTTDSAPDAYVIAGRVKMGRSRDAADLDAALAEFERVPRLFPDSSAVPHALAYAGETLRLRRRMDDALERFRRVTAEYGPSPASAAGHYGTGMVLAFQGDAIGAMEEFQRVRNRWPDAPEAAAALARSSELYRLYVKARSGAAYALSPDPVGPTRLGNVRSMIATPRDAVYYATESGVSLLVPPSAERPPVAARPRGLLLDPGGRLVVIEGSALRPQAGPPILLSIPQTGKPPRPLDKIDAAVSISSGDWLVMDEDEKVVNRFDRTGRHLGPFATARVSRLAINEFDEVAGIDRETKSIVIFDPSGKLLARIPAKGTGYAIADPEDLTFDALGHLFVLDRAGVYVFDPKRASRAAQTPAASGRTAAPLAPTAPLVTSFTQPESSPGAIRRATAFALDSAGRMYVADDRAEKIQLYS
jgi:TolA-binding protein